jgi:LCP family protein required for cell wall assembly
VRDLLVRSLIVLVVTLLVAGAGRAATLLKRFYGGGSLITNVRDTVRVIQDPRQFFPGRDRITVLCLGLDRNILRSRNPKLNGMPYTKGARSDVLMVASLDLADRTVHVLSIPRDTWMEYPGAHAGKINEAHARGGIPYTRQAVERLLEVPIDYHVVIRQEAIEAVAAALGGVRVNVEKDMDYDDRWGQLHIHLKRGEQELDGRQLVGYLRFRHDAEGDLGRIRRQQQVLHAIARELKRPVVLTHAGALIDAIHGSVQTDLAPEQQLALAHLFHRLGPDRVQTVSLPIIPLRGGSVVPDEARKQAAVARLLGRNSTAPAPSAALAQSTLVRPAGAPPAN